LLIPVPPLPPVSAAVVLPEVAPSEVVPPCALWPAELEAAAFVLPPVAVPIEPPVITPLSLPTTTVLDVLLQLGRRQTSKPKTINDALGAFPNMLVIHA